MLNLTAYVARLNHWRKFSGKPLLDVKRLSAADRTYIADSIEGDLSPENLTCDGELPNSEVNRRELFLENCKRELEALR